MTLKEFNDCTEEIAEVLDKYLKIEVNDLTEIKNPITNSNDLFSYEKFIDKIRENDFFYKKKFLKEKISFPYCLTIFKYKYRLIFKFIEIYKLIFNS